MRDTISLEDLKNIVEEAPQEEEEQAAAAPAELSTFRRYSKTIAITISYLLGVSDEAALKRVEDPQEYMEIKEKTERDEDARIIHHLNNIRSNLMLNFKNVSRALRDITADYKPLYRLDLFKDDFSALKKIDENVFNKIVNGRWDINEHLKNINDEISKRIDKLAYLFPEWVNFKNIRSLFIMPKPIADEAKRFQYNQRMYPFQRYLYWKEPEECGYILSADISILKLAYNNNGETFEDYGKVADASDMTKTSIGEFISGGTKIQIFVDGENADPYKFVSAIYSLANYEVDMIDKITVYYDETFTTKAWAHIDRFIDIPVEAVAVERISESKSLVDHMLVAGVSRAVYEGKADRIILVSSDSDFWSVIKFVSSARFLVMVESNKCGQSFKNILRSNNVFYCHLDKFKTVEDNVFLKYELRHEIEREIAERFSLGSAREIFNAAVRQSRAEISETEQEVFFKDFLKKLKLVVDADGNFKIEVEK